MPALFGTRISPHQLGLSDVLAALQILEMAPRSLVVLGIEPDSLDLGLELSPRLAACLDTLVDRVLGELRTLGLEPMPRRPELLPDPASECR